MGNAFGKKKKAAAAAAAETKPDGGAVGITISDHQSSIQKGASTESEESAGSSSGSESEAPETPKVMKGPPGPKKTAWTQADKDRVDGEMKKAELRGRQKDAVRNAESAMKATRGLQAQMGLQALPPYHNVVTGKIDGGCSTTMMSQKTYDQLKSSGACEQLAPATSVTSIYKFANGETKKANCHIAIGAEINGHQAEIHANVFNDPNTHFLLGLNFLRQHKVSIQYHPDGDRINCPALGLFNRVLPRDTAGLDVLPFFAPFPGEVNSGVTAADLVRKSNGQPTAAQQKRAAANRRKWE
jgi:hypothetical protein